MNVRCMSLTLFCALVLIASPAGAQEPETAQEATKGRSGFWLRGNFGFGYGNFSSDDGEISGAAGIGSISIGKFFNDRLVGFVDIAVSPITGPTLKVGGMTVSTDEDVTAAVAGLGIGVGYYLIPSSVFLGGSVTIAKLSLEENNETLAETDPGLAGSLILGKDFVISDKWTLGVAGQMILGTMTDKGGEPRWTTVATGLDFTFSFAPEKWRR
jgi:hypothetical protein